MMMIRKGAVVMAIIAVGKHCLQYHGKLGDGNGSDAKDLIIQPKEFHAPKSRGETDFEFRIAISNGILFSPMHSWRRQLTKEDMVDVGNYIRALAPSSAIS
jgi:hypothetical protein